MKQDNIKKAETVRHKKADTLTAVPIQSKLYGFNLNTLEDRTTIYQSEGFESPRDTTRHRTINTELRRSSLHLSPSSSKFPGVPLRGAESATR